MSTRTGIMLAKPFEERLVAAWPKPFFVQPKLDGLRCLAEWNGNCITLKSSQDNVVYSVPHINAELERILASNHIAPPRVLDGELYAPDLPFETLCSIVKRLDVHKNSLLISYYIFDMKSPLDFVSRTFFLERILGEVHRVVEPVIVLVDTFSCSDLDTVWTDFLPTFMDQGYEGIILRNGHASYQEKRTSDMLKFKPSREDVYTIQDYEEEHDIYGSPKGSLGSFLVCSEDGEAFSCGTGFTRQQRQDFWTDRHLLVGQKIRVRSQYLNERGIPRPPAVFVEVVECASTK